MITIYVVVTEDGEGYAQICNTCAAAKREVDTGVVDYDRPIADEDADCQLCGEADVTEDDKLNDKLNSVDEAVKAADELDDDCRKADVGSEYAKEILGSLRNAECVECVADFDASIAEARLYIPKLRAELKKNRAEPGVEDALDALNELVKELNDLH